MTLPTDTPPPARAPDAPPFDFDLFCQNCRYNLRGLMPDSRCPECGTPIAPLLLTDPLHFANPQWLSRLRRGAALLVWPIPIFIAAIIAAVADITVADILLLLATFLFVRGAWQLTTPEPERPGRHAVLRRLTRAAAALLLIACPLSLFSFSNTTSIVLFDVVSFLAAATTAGLLRHATDLARRLQRSILHSTAALLTLASLPAALIIAALTILSILYPRPTHTTLSEIVSATLAVILLLLLPTLLLAYPLFFHTLRKRLAAAQAYAEKCLPAAPLSSPQLHPVNQYPN